MDLLDFVAQLLRCYEVPGQNKKSRGAQ